MNMKVARLREMTMDIWLQGRVSASNSLRTKFAGLEATAFSFHFQIMRIHSRLLVPFVLAVLALPAHAATSAWTETPGGRIRVIIEDGIASGDDSHALRGALQIDLRPGWKTYWRNPGDAGVPPQINLDNGGTAHIAFPAPVRFGGEDEGGTGYDKPISLPLIFRIDPGGPRLKGHVFLGVCEKICIPVQAAFDFPLTTDANEQASPEAIAGRTIIEAAFDHLPDPASAEFGVTGIRHHGDKAIFEIALPDPHAPVELFIASDAIRLSKPEPDAGRRFVARIYGDVRKAVIDYTLVQNGKAVSGQVTLD